MKLIKKLGSIFPLITLTLFGTVEIARCHEVSPPAKANTQSVSREVLASGYPNDAQGRILELVRYTIPSGACDSFAERGYAKGRDTQVRNK